MIDISTTKTREETARQKRWTTLLLALITLFASFGFLAFWFFGPNPKIIVSKQTTHITTPLAGDGYPDYHTVLLADMKKGVTPENNGAIPIVRAFWDEVSKDVEPEEIDWLLKELGIEEPSPSESLTPLDTPEYRRGALEVLRKQLKPPVEDPNFLFTMEQKDRFKQFFEGPIELAIEDDEIKGFLYSCDPIGRPWTEKDLPFLANWINENQVVFDTVVEGLEMEGWYLPSCYSNNIRGNLLGVIYSISVGPGAARKLQTRSNYYLGMGEYDKAARDAMAIVRLGAKLDRGTFLVDKLLAMAITAIGYHQVREIAAIPEIPLHVLNYLHKELEAINFSCDIARSVDQGERYFQLDAVLSRDREVLFAHSFWGENPSSAEKIAAFTAKRLSVDWNQFLQLLNEHCDQLVLIYKLPTYKQQTAAIDAFEIAQKNRSVSLSLLKEIAYLFSPYTRASALGRYYLSDQSDSHAISISKFRNQNDKSITRIAVALAIYRSRNGNYPASLDQLIPQELKQLPVGEFSQLPFSYRRIEDKKNPGYLLYSLGANGLDDGGSSSQANNHIAGPPHKEGVISNDTSIWEQENHKMENAVAETADDPAYRIPAVPEPWPWEYVDLESSY